MLMSLCYNTMAIYKHDMIQNKHNTDVSNIDNTFIIYW